MSVCSCGLYVNTMNCHNVCCHGKQCICGKHQLLDGDKIESWLDKRRLEFAIVLAHCNGDTVNAERSISDAEKKYGWR